MPVREKGFRLTEFGKLGSAVEWPGPAVRFGRPQHAAEHPWQPDGSAAESFHGQTNSFSHGMADGRR